MPTITLNALTKRYGPGASAVDTLDLHVESGDFMCLLGPSGCGKTTLLRMIAGLEQASQGRLSIGDTVVDDPASGRFVSPEKRELGLVFQSYALWPHMSVAQNIDFGLRLRKLPAHERRLRTGEVMEKLGIAAYASRYPSQLSGGQQQRVALARMMVLNPRVLLLDEPLSNLDASLRLEMRAELKRLHQAFDTTIVFVTHDQWEAMTLASTIAVMRQGRLQQVGSPDDIYARPNNRFVAEFIGNPPINQIATSSRLGRRLDRDAVAHTLALRPEDLQLAPVDAPGTVAARVQSVMPTGGSWVLELLVDDHALQLSTQHRPQVRAGDAVGCRIDLQYLHRFDLDGNRLESGARPTLHRCSSIAYMQAV